jgi:hypothetical protein
MFLLFDVCNNDSYCDKGYGLAEELALKGKCIALSTWFQRNHKHQKEFFLFLFFSFLSSSM